MMTRSKAGFRKIAGAGEVGGGCSTGDRAMTHTRAFHGKQVEGLDVLPRGLVVC